MTLDAVVRAVRADRERGTWPPPSGAPCVVCQQPVERSGLSRHRILCGAKRCARLWNAAYWRCYRRDRRAAA